MTIAYRNSLLHRYVVCVCVAVLDVSVAALPLTRQQLVEEINQLHDVLPKLDSPVVFSHNDFLLQNVIYDEKARQYHCFTLPCPSLGVGYKVHGSSRMSYWKSELLKTELSSL